MILVAGAVSYWVMLTQITSRKTNNYSWSKQKTCRFLYCFWKKKGSMMGFRQLQPILSTHTYSAPPPYSAATLEDTGKIDNWSKQRLWTQRIDDTEKEKYSTVSCLHLVLAINSYFPYYLKLQADLHHLLQKKLALMEREVGKATRSKWKSSNQYTTRKQ